MTHAGEYRYTLHGMRPAMIDEGPTVEEAKVLAAHGRYLRERAGAGVVIHAGRTREKGALSMGVVIFRADSVESAEVVMNEDPAVAENVLRAELRPYRVVLHEAEPKGSERSDP